MESAPASTDPPFPHLFSPITIGGITIRNRIRSSGHDTVMAEGGLVTDRLDRPRRGDAAGRAGPERHPGVFGDDGRAAHAAVIRDTMTAAARRARVELRPTLRGFGTDDTAVFLQDVLTDDAVVVEATAALVPAQGHVPEDVLLAELEAAAPEDGLLVLPADDVQSPRTIEEAVLEGLRAGVAI